MTFSSQNRPSPADPANGSMTCSRWGGPNRSASPPLPSVIQEKSAAFISDCRRWAAFCLAQRAARSNSFGGRKDVDVLQIANVGKNPIATAQNDETSTNTAISRLSLGVGDRSCEVLCLSATASSRVMPGLIVAFAINSKRRCLGVSASAPRACGVTAEMRASDTHLKSPHSAPETSAFALCAGPLRDFRPFGCQIVVPVRPNR